MYQIGDSSNQNESVHTPPRRLLCLETGMRITNTFYKNILACHPVMGVLHYYPWSLRLMSYEINLSFLWRHQGHAAPFPKDTEIKDKEGKRL